MNFEEKLAQGLQKRSRSNVWMDGRSGTQVSNTGPCGPPCMMITTLPIPCAADLS